MNTYSSPDTMNYESHNSNNCIAVFSEIYYPEWKAYVDGKEETILKVNYVLRALSLKPGSHKIEFIYKRSYKELAIFSNLFFGNIIFLMLLLNIGIILKKKYYAPKADA